MDDGAAHIVVPDEDKRTGTAANGQQALFLEQGRDLVVHPVAQNGADAQHGLLQLRMRLPKVGQHFFHQPFVVAVGKAFVAAQRMVFAEPLGVVGVVAIGGATGRDHHMAHALCHAGLQHIARAADIDRVFKLAARILARGDDGGQVHHGVDAVLGQRLCQIRIAHVLLYADQARVRDVLRQGAHIDRDERLQGVLRAQGAHQGLS